MKRRAFLAAAGGAMVGLAGCLAAPEYTVTDVSVETEASVIDLAVRITDPDAVIEHPARLEFELTNTTDAPMRVRNTGIWPFGALILSQSTSPEEAQRSRQTTLWTDAYTESEHMRVEGRHSFGVESTPLTRSIDSGDSVTATYELHGDDLARTGTYYVYGKFEAPLLEYAGVEQDRFRPFLPTVSVSIAEKRLLPTF